MHHHTENEERAINLSILAVSEPGDCSVVSIVNENNQTSHFTN